MLTSKCCISYRNDFLLLQGSTEDTVLAILIASVLLAIAGLFLKGIYDVSSFILFFMKITNFPPPERTKEVFPIRRGAWNSCGVSFHSWTCHSQHFLHHNCRNQSLFLRDHLLILQVHDLRRWICSIRGTQNRQ